MSQSSLKSTKWQCFLNTFTHNSIVLFVQLETKKSEVCSAFFACLLHVKKFIEVHKVTMFFQHFTQTFKEIDYFICIMLLLSKSDSSQTVSAHLTIISGPFHGNVQDQAHCIIFVYSSWIAGNSGSNWGMKTESVSACSLLIVNSVSLPTLKLTLMDSLYSSKSSHGLMGVTYLTQVQSFHVGYWLPHWNTDVKCFAMLTNN